MKYNGTVSLNTEPLTVWDVVLDVDRFAACMPGVENLKKLDDRTFEGEMRAKVGPVSGNFSFQAQIVDSNPPTSLRAVVEGTDSLTNSTMTSEITMELEQTGSAQTQVAYHAEVNVKGRMGILGDLVLRATGAQVIEEFFNRLRKQVEGEG